MNMFKDLFGEIKYIKGVHCGDSECYACGTQRYNCSKLDKLDKLEDEKNETK